MELGSHALGPPTDHVPITEVAIGGAQCPDHQPLGAAERFVIQLAREHLMPTSAGRLGDPLRTGAMQTRT
jgi:hypothetical protein